jgi:hypothetical protein
MKQTISFSFSRKGTFDSCKKQYYLNYYGSKNGWFKSAPKETQETYYLKKLGNIYTWAGNVVHDTLQWLLLEIKNNNNFVTEQDAKAYAKRILVKQFDESQTRVKMWNAQEWGWKDIYGLKEHAYNLGVDASQRQMVFNRVNDSLSHFFSSEIFKKILNSDPRQWKSIDDFSTYDVQITDDFKIPVFSVPDFAMKHDGKLYIYDWKTGKRNPKYKEQLALYAVYADRFWGVTPENIVCEIFYLLPNETEIVDISQSTINKMLSKIKVDALAMLETLENKDGRMNKPLPAETFPITDNRSSCFFCNFSRICGIKN